MPLPVKLLSEQIAQGGWNDKELYDPESVSYLLCNCSWMFSMSIYYVITHFGMPWCAADPSVRDEQKTNKDTLIFFFDLTFSFFFFHFLTWFLLES